MNDNLDNFLKNYNRVISISYELINIIKTSQGNINIIINKSKELNESVNEIFKKCRTFNKNKEYHNYSVMFLYLTLIKKKLVLLKDILRNNTFFNDANMNSLINEGELRIDEHIIHIDSLLKMW